MEQTANTEQAAVWATVSLMGHVELAGRLSKPTDWGGLFQLDVPVSETEFATKFFGGQSVYSIDIVSEQIARAMAQRSRQIVAYDAPIITREAHESVVAELNRQTYRQAQQIRELEHRLTAVNALPAPAAEDENGDGGPGF